MSELLKILLSNVNACQQRITKLNYSLNKIRPIFPLDIEKIAHLTDEQEESIDALILRYSQTVAMIQEQLFRGIAYLEQEDLSNKSNRDKALLMEKLGVIRSADEFGTAAVLRNKFAHHYPDAVIEQIKRLNLIITEADFIIDVFKELIIFLKHKGYLI